MSRNAKAVKTKRDESEPLEGATTQIESQDEDPSHHLGEQLVGSPRNGEGRELPDFETKMSDLSFQQRVDAICRRVFNALGPLKTHTWEDLRQESLIKLYEAYEHFRGDAALETYFERIVRNQLGSMRRKQTAQKRPDEVLDIDSWVEQPRATSKDKLENNILLNECLDKLSPEDRSVVTSYFVDGMLQDELAEELNMTKQGVSIKLHRIIEKTASLIAAPPRE